MIPDREKIFDAFRNCITEPKCRDCPWEQCEQFNQKKVSIPVTLALDVLNLLKEQEEHSHELQQIINDGFEAMKVATKRIKELEALMKEQPDVVRCKDCKYGEPWGVLIGCGKSKGFGITHNPDWFCADGERS